MKNLILLLCLISLPAFSQNKVKLNSYFEGGYYNYQLNWDANVLKYNAAEPWKIDGIGYGFLECNTGDYLKDRMFAQFGFDAFWKNFKLYTTLMTVFKPYAWYGYTPLQSQYDIGLTYTLKNLEFRSHHMCTHSSDQVMLGGGYTTFSVRVYFLKNQ